MVNASSGLIIREQPNADANRIGKLPYGSIVNILENTNLKLQITDKGEVIDGEWVKVKFQNFPYIITKTKAFKDEGFVFSGYLEKLEKAKIETIEIDSLRFYKLYKASKRLKQEKLTSIAKVEKVLASTVKWQFHNVADNTMDHIILDNDQVLQINQDANDVTFSAYYPKERILLFEGGHSSDFSISLKAGESLETVGNPEYIIVSPHKKYRLNGYFGGQECSSYFFQEITGDTYKYLASFNNVSCYIYKFYWLNDQEFVYCDASFATPEKGEQNYYLGKILIQTN
tara:strand:- start:360 stop:1217 length:858 start_codon:yes stop_codon:yes gene_type:complete